MTPATGQQSPPSLEHADWLTNPAIQAVFAALADAGYSARAVGGAVRNALLGHEVADIDIATTAHPEDVLSVMAGKGLKAVPTGVAHGTVTVVTAHLPVEVTTLREDVETFGRHAKVAFTADWEADARRRDFTMNALYCNADGSLFDPLGGYEDLAAGRVRFIGSARERIREDYLRILRFFRFNATYGRGDYDRDGLTACVQEHAGLSQLSRERVRAELLRLLAAPRGLEAVETMLHWGLLVDVLGVAPQIGRLVRMISAERLAAAPASGILRLCALCIGTREDAERLAGRLRLSRREAGVLADCAWHELPGELTEGALAMRRLAYRFGRERVERQALVRLAASRSKEEETTMLETLAQTGTWQPPSLPFSGADVMALGVPSGPRIGTILASFESWWLAHDFPRDETLLAGKLRELAAAPDAEGRGT
ncbi:MAG: CCA tRNA nucleotidyltransferase [Hyphomicrobiaceae bacterium]|nr:CCA tRNA nucleotidyltransferase [Hyphomicrobiaceae bacterium]